MTGIGYSEIKKHFCMNFLGRVENGKLNFNSLDWVKEKIKEYEGRVFKMSIPVPQRSLSQNAFYWGVYLPILAEDTGHTTEELHAWAKKRFLPRTHAVVMGEEVELEKSTKDLTKSEFAEYIMNIEADTGIPAPSPEEAGFISNKNGL